MRREEPWSKPKEACGAAGHLAFVRWASDGDTSALEQRPTAETARASAIPSVRQKPSLPALRMIPPPDDHSVYSWSVML